MFYKAFAISGMGVLCLIYVAAVLVHFRSARTGNTPMHIYCVYEAH